MQFKFRFLLPIFGILFVSCSFSPNELKTASRLMDAAPDSALHILRQMTSPASLSDGNRALYGLLYGEALDLTDRPLPPDSIIDFSLNYYEHSNDQDKLAICSYLKGKSLKNSQKYDNATIYYLKAIDIIPPAVNPALHGKIYADMGYISSVQQEYIDALRKYRISVDYFRKAGKAKEACSRILEIGRTYRFMHNYKMARKYYMQVLRETSDSLLHGLVLQEMGVNCYWEKDYNSAKRYLRESLRFPYKNFNYSIRYYTLSDLYFDIKQLDSSFYCATEALKYPANFVTQRECYRLLANTTYLKGDFKQMAVYMTHFQAMSDSVRKIEAQTKTTVLEGMYKSKQEVGKTKKYLFILFIFIPFILVVGLFILIRQKKRNRKKEEKLKEVGMELNQKQSLLVESLLQKIQEQRSAHFSQHKKMTLHEREVIEKEIYMNCLHLNDWDSFKKLMDATLKNVLSEFEHRFPEVNRKEQIWICLSLLNIPNPEIALILDSQPSSLYKMKQRLAQKMKLKGTKELDAFLDNFISGSSES